MIAFGCGQKNNQRLNRPKHGPTYQGNTQSQEGIPEIAQAQGGDSLGGAQGLQGSSGGGITTGAQDLQGPSVGGGGFVKKNSETLLKLAVTDLVEVMKMSPLGMWEGLPEDISRDDFIDIIQNIKSLPEEEKVEIDQDTKEMKAKMFHYAVVDGKREIQALSPFFMTYAGTPISNSLSESNRLFLGSDANAVTIAQLRDVQHKLVHEVSHFIKDIGGNDNLAHKFASAVMRSLHSNVFICHGLKNSLDDQSLDGIFDQENAIWFDRSNPPNIVDTYVNFPSGTEEHATAVKDRLDENLTDFWYYRFFTLNIHSGNGFRNEMYTLPGVAEQAGSKSIELIQSRVENYLNDLQFAVNSKWDYPESKDFSVLIKTKWIEKQEKAPGEFLIRTEMDASSWPWKEKEMLELTLDRNTDTYTISVPSHKMAVGSDHEYTDYPCKESYENIYDNYEKILNIESE